MRVSRRPYRLIVLALLITAVLTVSLGAFHLYRFYESYRSQYEARALLSAQIFADSVSGEVGRERLQAITQAFVRGDVLFAQVVREGRIVAEDRTEPALGLDLSVDGFRGRLVRREGRLGNGTPYLELVRPFVAATPSASQGERSYVRVGFSLRDVRSALKAEVLLVIGVGLAALALVGLGGLTYRALIGRRPRPERARGEEVAGDGVGGREQVRVGPLLIDRAGKGVWLNGRPVDLSPKEYDLVNLLASEPGRVFSNREILERVWETSHAPTAKDVKQYIYLLRRKLELDAERPQLIINVRGFGYKLAPDPDPATGEDHP